MKKRFIRTWAQWEGYETLQKHKKTKNKKVLILGIDALDFDLVEEWNLKNLKQEEYGKTIVPITDGLEEPATVIVWPCFITGKEPKDMGFDTPVIYRQPFKWFFDTIYVPTTSSFADLHPEDIVEKRDKKRIFLDKISSIFKKGGIYYQPSRANIKAPTLFDDESLKTAHFHIPVYDKDVFPEYRKSIVDVITKEMPGSEFSKACKKSFNMRCEELLNYLKQNNEWDIVMMYWFCLDAVQHAFFKNKLKIMDFYLMFNEFVGNLKKTLTKDILILIISDHGQKKGIHTDKGFYSCNKKLGLENPKITDFKEIIEKELKKQEIAITAAKT